ncbi:MAG: hypothetical protein NTW78_12540 [Campylobacterales bacterium]|nr:hypothetical protein [Campylobacterales bacterium]
MKIDDIYRKIRVKKFLDIEPTDVIEDARMIGYFVTGAHANNLTAVRIPDYEEIVIMDFEEIKNTYRTDTTYQPFFLQRAKFDISDFSKYQILDVIIDKSQKAWLVKEVKNDEIMVQKYPLLNKDNVLYKVNAKNTPQIESVWEVTL